MNRPYDRGLTARAKRADPTRRFSYSGLMDTKDWDQARIAWPDVSQYPPELIARARSDAALHANNQGVPSTPGLPTTESDPRHIVLYNDVRRHQIQYEVLRDVMPDQFLYWLAAHEHPPDGIDPNEWTKLAQNATRARAAIRWREQQRLAGQQASAARRTAIVSAVIAAIVALSVSVVGWAIDDASPAGPSSGQPTTTR